MLSYTSPVTIGLDATPLSVSSGGIGRYTLELARALAAEFPEDQYWLLSDQTFHVAHDLPNLHTGNGPSNLVERKWWAWGLNQEMARHGVELFHGTDYAVPYLGHRPSVMTLHDLSPDESGVATERVACTAENTSSAAGRPGDDGDHSHRGGTSRRD